jgi:hypothetical protein
MAVPQIIVRVPVFVIVSTDVLAAIEVAIRRRRGLGIRHHLVNPDAAPIELDNLLTMDGPARSLSVLA